MKRISALMLLVFLIILNFSACSNENKSESENKTSNITSSSVSESIVSDVSDDSTTSQSSETASAFDPHGFYINGVAINKFSIIRPHYNSSYLTQIQLEQLRDKLNAEFGFKTEICDDTYTESSQYEIIVGNTNRKFYPKMEYDDFCVEIDGGKVYLYGGSPHSTAMAVSEFIRLVDKGSLNNADSLLKEAINLKVTASDVFNAPELSLTAGTFNSISSDSLYVAVEIV